MSQIVDLRKKNKPSFQAKVEKKKETTPPIKEAFLAKQEANLTPEKINHFEWDTPSFYYNPQKKYLVLIIIALLVTGSTMLFYHMDTLTAIFIILSSCVLMLYANKKPDMVKIIVNQVGITIEDKLYFFRDLKSFWIDYNPNGPKELILEAKKWYMPYIKISIENQNPVDIRSLIINFITEREHEKSLVDLISRKIGL